MQKISKRNRDVVYIVPTLSLVNQVTEDFNNMLKELGIGNYKIANTFMQVEDLNINNIYVLTQEKALAAFANEEAAFSKPLILVADEIQNIERIKDDRDERSKILFDILMEFRYKENVEEVGSRLINNYAITMDGKTIFLYDPANDQWIIQK